MALLCNLHSGLSIRSERIQPIGNKETVAKNTYFFSITENFSTVNNAKLSKGFSLSKGEI
jgi:hypothetical protein